MVESSKLGRPKIEAGILFPTTFWGKSLIWIHLKEIGHVLEKGFAANTGDVRPKAVHLGASGKQQKHKRQHHHDGDPASVTLYQLI